MLQKISRSIILFTILLSACQLSISNKEIAESVSPPSTLGIPSPTIIPTIINSPIPSSTLTPTYTSTSTPRPTPKITNTPRPSPTFTPTAVPISDSVLRQLLNQGYEQGEIPTFKMGEVGGMLFGGGQDEGSFTKQQDVVAKDGSIYTYMQLVKNSEKQQSFHLLFYRTIDGKTIRVADINVSELNGRLRDVLSPHNNKYYDLLFITSLGWQDVNGNGNPDVPINFIWGNNYNGSEIHIFEVEDGIITNLTKDLPGIISPWDFDPGQPFITVFDLRWADHDCIYPPITIFWLYTWDAKQEKYVDKTTDVDLSDYFDDLKDQYASFTSEFFDPSFITPLVELLVMRDRNGQREIGWKEYTELIESRKWENTRPQDIEVFASDFEHFKKEYEGGLPFSPNAYCDHFAP